jgi:uncharacterized protein (UPF0147 family)
MSTAAERREKRRVENEQKVKTGLDVLRQVADNSSIPRSVRRTVREAIDALKDDKVSIGVRAANAVSILEGVSRDPNLPSFSRVTIWSAVSTLESVREV